MLNKIFSMLQLQQQLNDTTNGENWENGITKNAKHINWKRCIYMECAEMVDSFAWKHWKSIDKPNDWNNHKIEVVDVWHFIMSEALRDYNIGLKGNVEDLALNISQSLEYARIVDMKETYGSIEDIFAIVEEIMCTVLNKSEFDIEKLLKQFFHLVELSGLNLDSLYRLYVGKNILNQFRQDNGYKDGTYIKVWDGLEDNMIMKKIWEDNDHLKPEQLYRELAKQYTALTQIMQ